MKIIDDKSQLKLIKESIGKFIVSFFIDNPFYTKWAAPSANVYSLLFFDEGYIRDISDLKKIISHSKNKQCYIGYLSGLSIKAFNSKQNYPWIVSESDSDNDIYQNFEREPDLDDEAPIAYCVSNGFVLDSDKKWFIWFSTPSEIAIAMFLNVEEARNFRSSMNHIYFLDNMDLLNKYSMSPNFGKIKHMISKYEHLNYQPDSDQARH